MAFCPADFKTCIDDLCYSGGCLSPLAYGESMLVPCGGCKRLIAMDGSNDDDCECEPDYDRDEDEWEDEE